MVVFYDIADDLHLSADPIVCHCLRVRESAVVHAVEERGADSVRDLMASTGAGSGCTACHCTLRQYLLCRRQQAVA